MVNGEDDVTEIEIRYGITVTQSTAKDGATTLLYITPNYFQTDLDGTKLDIEIVYNISETVTLTLPTITGNYVGAPKEILPYFEGDLPSPSKAPAINSLTAGEWLYEIPEATSDLGIQLSYSFSSPTLGDMILFDEGSLSFRYNLDYATPETAASSEEKEASSTEESDSSNDDNGDKEDSSTTETSAT